MELEVEKPIFSVGQRVLCYHGPLLYEAKITNVKRSKDDNDEADNEKGRVGVDGSLLFFVHYKGWKTKWDEWVPSNRLVNLDSNGISLAKKLRSAHSSNINLDKKRRHSVEASLKEETTATATATWKPVEISTNLKTSEIRPINIALGGQVRKSIATDWEMITKKQRLHALPAVVSVNKILKLFQDVNPNDESLKDFCDGIEKYFNLLLTRVLLYRFERHQLLDLYNMFESSSTSSEGDTSFKPSLIYGAEHFGRLFVKLPIFVADAAIYSDSNVKTIKTFGSLLQKLLDFLESNFTSLFRQNHILAEPDYISRSKNS